MTCELKLVTSGYPWSTDTRPRFASKDMRWSIHTPIELAKMCTVSLSATELIWKLWSMTFITPLKTMVRPAKPLPHPKKNPYQKTSIRQQSSGSLRYMSFNSKFFVQRSNIDQTTIWIYQNVFWFSIHANIENVFRFFLHGKISRMSFDSKFFMQRCRECLFSEFFLQAKIESIFPSFFFMQ